MFVLNPVKKGFFYSFNVQAEIDWEDLLYIDSSFIRRDDQYLQAGDIVMSMANSRELVGKVSYADSIPVERATFGGFLGVIRPYRLSASYLMCVLRAPQARASLIDSASQTTNIANISLEKLNPLVVALPPLAEQRRIVAKVDELMALCDQLEQQTDASLSAHQTLVETLLNTLTSATDHAQFASSWQRIVEHFDTLFTTEESIDQLKQTILQLAVMGKLVPQDPNDEPASELLNKIAADKAKLVKEGKIKKDKPLTAFAEEEKPFELPMGWAWSRFDGLIDPEYQISYGVLVPGPDVEDGVPFVRIEDLSLQNPTEQPNKKIAADIDQQYARTRLVGGEILMGVVGSIGKLGIAPESWRGANIARAVCRIVPTKFLHRDYIVQILQSNFMQESFVGDTRTLAQPTLNIGFIRDTLTPVPPVAEQHRIVAKVDELMALCDQFKARLSDVQATQLNLADTFTEAALAGA